MEFYWKLILFIAIMVIAYFILEYFWDIDYIEIARETITDIGSTFTNVEWDARALTLTIVFSSIIWGILWFTPFWSTIPLSECGRFLICVRSLPHKLFFTLGTLLFGYPLALRSLNKD